MSDQPNIRELTEDETWEILGKHQIGRLATAVGGDVEIFPVNFAATNRRIFVRTAPGSKLAEIAVNGHVAFEVDEVGADLAYSVVLKGAAEILEHDDDITDAEATGLLTFLDTHKPVWLRITPTAMSGRRFTR
ncbi:pyridoxamine 5'-phosphate oxidase family protein [Xylanimonas ulmi]|uniref:Pyridoxamine 5'-phosphate oxidase-like protein n=1 Tax=Xylanimonas ulmi TaxID=228973 RepID=A0A4Q7M4Q0_9MICO|nr:pyridoxamine 5'-phosphate oxidase family protein [Xylanibacterium ulmi]RZS62945.1 pyridoxamine 5'-phosphate oxidase-like protein [Xylanibacterium ulmi]